MDFNGNSVLHSLGDGSESAPSQYFRGEPTSGMYREVSGPSTTSIAFSKKGTKRLRITDTGVDVIGTLTASSYVPSGTTSLPDGSASAPSLAFTSSTSSGMFWDTTGTAGQAWSAGGNKRLKLETNRLTSEVRVGLPNGSESAPALFFNSGSTSGLSYSPGPDWMQLHLSGTTKMLWASDHTTSVVPVELPSGSASSPSVSFTSSTNSGVYFDTASQKVSTSVGGVDRLSVSSTSVTTSVPIDSGTNGMTCGDLTASGRVKAALGTVDFPGIAFTDAPSVGLQSGGPLAKTLNVCTDTNIVAQFSPLVTNFTVPIDCSSITASGPVTQPRYWLRLYRSTTQAISNNTGTFVSWNATESSGGASSNWPISLPATLITIPIYLVTFRIIFAQSGTGTRIGWMTHNSGVPDAPRRYAEILCVPPGGAQSGYGASEVVHCDAGDTIGIVAHQGSGGSLNLLGSSQQASTLRIVRLHE